MGGKEEHQQAWDASEAMQANFDLQDGQITDFDVPVEVVADGSNVSISHYQIVILTYSYSLTRSLAHSLTRLLAHALTLSRRLVLKTPRTMLKYLPQVMFHVADIIIKKPGNGSRSPI